MKLITRVTPAWIGLITLILLATAGDLSAQSQRLSGQAVLTLDLGRDASKAFQSHGKMDIPLIFAIKGEGGNTSPELQLVTVHVKDGRVASIGRSRPFTPPGRSMESSIGARAHRTCCIDWCRGDGEGNWETSRTCGNPCSDPGDVGLITSEVAQLPAVNPARMLPRQDADFNQFAATQFDQRLRVDNAVMLAIVPTDRRAFRTYSSSPLLLGVENQGR